MDELTFVEAVVKPPADAFTTALALITEKRQAVNYRDEKKWLHFLGPIVFVTALLKKMQAAHRRQYGLSAPFSHKLIIQDGMANLYINTQGY